MTCQTLQRTGTRTAEPGRSTNLPSLLDTLEPGGSVMLTEKEFERLFGRAGSETALRRALDAGARHRCDVLFGCGDTPTIRFTKPNGPERRRPTASARS